MRSGRKGPGEKEPRGEEKEEKKTEKKTENRNKDVRALHQRV